MTLTITPASIAEALGAYSRIIHTNHSRATVLAALAAGDTFEIASEVIDAGIDAGAWAAPTDDDDLDEFLGRLIDDICAVLPIAAAIWQAETEGAPS